MITSFRPLFQEHLLRFIGDIQNEQQDNIMEVEIDLGYSECWNHVRESEGMK